jgi:hypothetical protein
MNRNQRTEWEQMTWLPEPLFAGKTVFCLTSGPSLTPEICDRLQGQYAIAVNSSGYLAPWADVLLFTDCGWFEHGRAPEHQGRQGHDTWPRRAFVERWRGLVVSFAPVVKRILDDPDNPYLLARLPRICRVRACIETSGTTPPMRHGKSGFPLPPDIQCGRSTGHMAVSLAHAMGAARICLVGYDMRVVDGREHHHDDYKGQPRDLEIYANEFVPAFAGWHAAALNDGFEILNCTPGSAVTEFPFADLDAVLASEAA